MKKIIFLFSVSILFLASCTDKDAFTIKGKLPSDEYNGQQVYLQILGQDWKENVTIDTANVVDGQFIFKGLAKEAPAVHFIVLDNAPQKMKRPVPVILEPGDIEVVLDSIPSVKGTPNNNELQAYTSKILSLEGEMKSLSAKAKLDTTEVNLQKIDKQLEEKDEQYVKDTYEYLKSNIGTPIGDYFFTRNYYMFPTSQQRELLDKVSPAYKANPRIERIVKSVELQEATAAGAMYVDLKGKTPKGKDASLSDYAGKGKYVLVDFWASWCGPCRAEMPKIVSLYKQYKDKDFEIVGVSLDNDAKAWQEGIDNLVITWPQISDLQGWNSIAVSTYGISSIPHLMLLDKEGKILERGLTANKAKEKLAELLK